MTLQEWRKQGATLLVEEGGMNWRLGDWFNAGRQFVTDTNNDCRVTQDDYDEAIAELFPTPIERRRTLYTCAWVARCVPSSRRSELLSWSHHREVAPLEAADQVRWLKVALEKGLSVVELRVAIAGNERPDHTPISFSPASVARDCVRWLRDADAWEPERVREVLDTFALLRARLDAMDEAWCAANS